MITPMSKVHAPVGLLGDTAARDYAGKLRRFNAFAAPELREAIAELSLRSGSCVLDAGCGTGEAVGWLREAMSGEGTVIGLDLAAEHVRNARAITPPTAFIVQSDMLRPPLAAGTVDFIWAVNSLNHLHDPIAGVLTLSDLLRPGGRIAVGQSALVPEMYFAWDARLEAVVHEAIRRYYRERYGRSERDLTAVRAVTGWLRQAGLQLLGVRTRMIERICPLSQADEDYLLEAVFRGTWGERLRPYLSQDDFVELTRLCNPDDERYALRRADFHFLQSLTIAVAVK